MGVALGEDQGLGCVLPPGEDQRQHGISVLPDNRPDLVHRDHTAVQLGGRIVEIVGQLAQLPLAGALVLVVQELPGLHRRALLTHPGTKAVHVEVYVHPVGDRPFVAVLHHQVLVEEADGAGVRGGGQAGQEGVEVFQHLPPGAVDAAVALVGEDEVKRLDGQLGIVAHGAFGLILTAELEAAALLVAGVELGLTPEDAVQPLDGRDYDLGVLVDQICLEVLDVVQVSELAPVIGGAEVAELTQRLLAQVATVYQEQHPFGPSVLQ